MRAIPRRGVGVAADNPATVRWDAVPRAGTYDVSVRRNRCDHTNIEVTAGAGEVGAFLTIIDGATDDSTYTVIAPQSPTRG